MLPLFSVVFVDMLGFGLILPLLPYIAANWGATPAVIGLIGAAYPLGQFFGAPLVGRFSDRFGRKPLLLFSITGTFLSLLMLGFAQSIAIIMISRFLDGLTGGNITVAQAYISDVTDEKSRAKGMGMIGAAFGLGFILGPASGGFLSQWGYAVPAFVSASLSLINLFLIAFLLPESLPKEKQVHHLSEAKRSHPLKGLTAAFAKPIAGPISGSIIVFSCRCRCLNPCFSFCQTKTRSVSAIDGICVGLCWRFGCKHPRRRHGHINKTVPGECACTFCSNHINVVLCGVGAFTECSCLNDCSGSIVDIQRYSQHTTPIESVKSSSVE